MASGYARISMAKCFSCFYNFTIFLLPIQVIIYFLTYVSVYRKTTAMDFVFRLRNGGYFLTAWRRSFSSYIARSAF